MSCSKGVYYVLKLLNRVALTLMFLMGLLLGLLAVKPLSLNRFKGLLEKELNVANGLCVEVEGVYLSVFRFKPVLKFKQLKVTGNSELSFQAQAVRLGIDFFKSCGRKSIVLDLLAIHNGQLVIAKELWSTRATEEVPVTAGSAALQQLLENGDLICRNLNVEYREKGKVRLSLTKIKGELHNYLRVHRLSWRAREKHASITSKVMGQLLLKGSLIDGRIDTCTGRILVRGGKADFRTSLLDSVGHMKDKGSGWWPKQGDLFLAVESTEALSDFLANPLFIDRFQARFHWNLEKNRVIRISNLVFSDRYLQLQGSSSLDTTDWSNPGLDIQLFFRLRKLARIGRYCPEKLMDPELFSWLTKGFREGELTQGSLKLTGMAQDFPFDKQKGKFIVNAAVRRVELLYHPDWPVLHDLDADLCFENESLTIVAKRGKFLKIPIKAVKGKIADFTRALLEVEGIVYTDSKEGLAFVRQSALRSIVSGRAELLALTGPMTLSLKLKIPLSEQLHDQKSEVDGKLVFENNCLKVGDIHVGIEQISGEMYFTDQVFASRNLTGVLFNQPVNLFVTTLHDGTTRFDLHGWVNIEAVTQQIPIKFRPYLDGQFNYNLSVKLPQQGKEGAIDFESDLQGLALRLPAPFVKEADEITPLRLRLVAQENGEQVLTATWKELLDMHLEFTDQKNPRLLGGEILLGEKGFGTTTEGLVLKGKFDRLDYTEWLPLLSETNDVGHFSFASVFLQVKELFFNGQKLSDVLINLNMRKDSYDLVISSEEVKGDCLIPKVQTGVLKGKFSKVFLPQIFSGSGGKRASFQNFNWLGLELQVDHLILGKYPIYNFNCRGARGDAGEFKVQNLSLEHQGLELRAQGELKKGGEYLTGTVKIKSLGDFVKSMGISESLRGGEGTVRFKLSREGGNNLAWQKLRGELSVHLVDGVIVHLGQSVEDKLNVGKAVNILDVQSLIKNLGLDFKGYRSGFAYNSLDSKLLLDAGKLVIADFKIKSTPADVKVHGHVNLLTRQCDLRLALTPKLTGSVPVVATVVGGPVVGAITFVANKVVNKVVDSVLDYRYRISGSIDNPVIMRE